MDDPNSAGMRKLSIYPQQEGLKKEKVLLSDDEELFLELEKTFFSRDKFELLVAQAGEQTLDMVQIHRPDLVLLDLFMSGEGGDSCCRCSSIFRWMIFMRYGNFSTGNF